jgi:class 3 adenylate cyclase
MLEIVRGLSQNPLMALDQQIRNDSETELIQSALTRIGSLLQIAFGEAGTEIIARNLSAEGEFDPMVKGRKVHAIFGFTDIRQFTNATEVLEEHIVELVNEIAFILHQCVGENEGFANRNVGDAFLLVWKDVDVADRVLDSFLQTVDKLKKSEAILQITQKIQEKIPEYTLKMGFGVHFGWAVEGAVGSRYKVDPTYLSPHVNMASRLEEATKQFGISILISEQFYTLLSPAYKAKCRRVDRVMFKGSSQPMSIYTIDLDMPERCDATEYRKTFEAAVDAYLAGIWGDTKPLLEKCFRMWKQDGPAATLWNVMERQNWKAPVNWEGYRKLTQK